MLIKKYLSPRVVIKHTEFLQPEKFFGDHKLKNIESRFISPKKSINLPN
jgi:hypothetical protein